jgi:PIN domain nuclease of toxin-antitoxin system
MVVSKMIILLDTSVVLYILKYPERLGENAKKILENNTRYISTVSLWEIAIKQKKGKLRVKLPISNIPYIIGATLVHIQPQHTDAYLSIDINNKDPFDTMLIAQSKSEGMDFITSDRILIDSKYDVIDARI